MNDSNAFFALHYFCCLNIKNNPKSTANYKIKKTRVTVKTCVSDNNTDGHFKSQMLFGPFPLKAKLGTSADEAS